MSFSWEDLYPLVSVRKLVREVSDHNPLLLSTGEDERCALVNREFRFELSWLKNEEFFTKAKSIWEQNVRADDPIDILNIKLKRIKKYFKGWGSNKFGHSRKRKDEIRKELEEIEKLEEMGPLDPGIYEKRTLLCAEYNEILNNDELFWLQQSNERWLLKGDRNTTFFHRVANGRKRKNTIHSFVNGDVVIEGTENLLRHATDFYKELFGPANGNMFHLDPNTWSIREKISVEDNDLITSRFTEEEVRKALFSMESNKAPGPDNIPAEFYKHCWEFVKKDLMRLFDAFHNNSLDVARLNYGVITLLPKLDGAKEDSTIQTYLFATLSL